MTDRARRKKALTGLTAVAFSALTIMAPAAMAQVPTVDVPTVDVPTTGGGGGGGGGGDVGGTVGGAVGTVTDTVDTTTGSAGSPAGNIGPVIDPTGGTLPDPNTTVDETKKTIDNTTSGAGETVNSTAGGAENTAGSLGGTIGNPDLNVRTPLDRDGDGKITKNERTSAARRQADQTGSGSKVAAALSNQRRLDREATAAKNARLASLEKDARNKGTHGIQLVSAPLQRETFITQLADAAVEATKKLAFPLGLALMVGAFLMVQGRIDRKDAKLALAPINSEQDLLSFQ